MDNITQDLRNLELVPFAEKLAPGKRGKPQELKTNLTKLVVPPNIPFYKYDLRMHAVFTSGKEKEITKQTKEDFPEQMRKALTVPLFRKLVENNKKVFSAKTLFYDRAAILYSLVQLKIQDEEVFELPANSVDSKPLTDVSKFVVKLKKVADSFQCSTNDLKNAATSRSKNDDLSIIEALTLLISQPALLDSQRFVTYGNGVHYLMDTTNTEFRNDDLPSLPDGKYLGAGASKSIKVLEGSAKENFAPYAVVEVKKTAFHNDEQPLLAKLGEYSMFARTGFSVAAANNNQRRLASYLKGIYCVTTYGKSKQVVEISGLGPPAKQISFKKGDGQSTTMVQYFQSKHSKPLKYAELFTVMSRQGTRTNYYPVEYLNVAMSQRVIGAQQTPEQIATMIKSCAALPATRLRQTEYMKKALQVTSENPSLKEVGITVEPALTEVPSRVLPTPTIQYAGKTATPIDNSKWNGETLVFLKPATLSSWRVLVNLNQNDARRVNVNEYIKRLMIKMKAHGMKVNDPVIKVITPGDIENVMASAKNENCQLLFFITSDFITTHAHMKALETKYDVVTQEVKSSKVLSVMEKNQVQTLDNIVNKTNKKLGGQNFNVILGPEANVKSYILDPSRLFIGFEFSHPAPLSASEKARGVPFRNPSVLGWSANCSENPQNFIGDYLYTAPRESDKLGAHIKTLVKEILSKFRAARKAAPGHIIFLYNGIEKGQWNLVAGYYMKKVREGLAELSANYKPKLTAIAVTKEHNERLFNKVIKGNRAAEQNISPGSVVDSVIVHPSVNEFYLNAHSAFQGTAKTPKFSIIIDESKMPMDVVEAMMHGLCYLHEIVNMTISLPAPIRIAWECAKRGAANFADTYSSQSSEAADLENLIEAANANLRNKGKLTLVRYNA